MKKGKRDDLSDPHIVSVIFCLSVHPSFRETRLVTLLLELVILPRYKPSVWSGRDRRRLLIKDSIRMEIKKFGGSLYSSQDYEQRFM